MKLLLDTHAFLWLNDDSERLSQTVKELCNTGEHEFYLSIASPWEMQIKHQLGKLSLLLDFIIDEVFSEYSAITDEQNADPLKQQSSSD